MFITDDNIAYCIQRLMQDPLETVPQLLSFPSFSAMILKMTASGLFKEEIITIYRCMIPTLING